MEPLTIAGALIGVFLNKLLPEQLLVLLLVALLSFTAYTTLSKAIKMYKRETINFQRERESKSLKQSELTEISHTEERTEAQHLTEALMENQEQPEAEDGISPEPIQNEELKQILDEEKETPMANIMVLLTMFVVILFINLIKGGGAFPSPLGIKCGSASFWIANLIMLVWIVVISCLARAYLVRRYEIKERVGYKYVDGDIQWNARATVVYPVICCLAGFFAGMFGIGGGKFINVLGFAVFS